MTVCVLLLYDERECGVVFFFGSVLSREGSKVFPPTHARASAPPMTSISLSSDTNTRIPHRQTPGQSNSTDGIGLETEDLVLFSFIRNRP